MQFTQSSTFVNLCEKHDTYLH